VTLAFNRRVCVCLFARNFDAKMSWKLSDLEGLCPIGTRDPIGKFLYDAS